MIFLVIDIIKTKQAYEEIIKEQVKYDVIKEIYREHQMPPQSKVSTKVPRRDIVTETLMDKT